MTPAAKARRAARVLGYHQDADIVRAGRRAMRWRARNPGRVPPAHIGEKMQLIPAVQILEGGDVGRS